MRKTALISAGLLLVFSLRAASAFGPPATYSPVAQEEKKAEKQKKEKPSKKTEDKEEKESEEEEEKPRATPALDAVKSLTTKFEEQGQAFMKKTREPGFMKDYRKAAREGRDAAQAFLKEAGRPDPAEYAAEMKEVAAYSLAWLATNSRGAEGRNALKYLFENHVSSPAMELVVDMAGFGVPSKTAQKRFETLLKKNNSTKVKAIATFELANALAAAEPEDTTKIEELYQTVIEEYGDVEGRRGKIADQAKSALYEIQYLTLGKVAPEIEGEDLDGVKFKLSDYRGKVVLLDFWGNW